MIDKKKIRRSFNAHAASYDGSAHLQRRVAEELAERSVCLASLPRPYWISARAPDTSPSACAGFSPRPSLQACDLARGMLLVARDKKRRRSRPPRPVLSMPMPSYCPTAAAPLTCWFSSLAYQWLENWRAPSGSCPGFARRRCLLFYHPGSGTLCELRDSYRRSYHARGDGKSPALHEFVRQEESAEHAYERGFR